MATYPTIHSHEATQPGRSANALVRHLSTAARVLMGLVFLVSGLFGLLMAAGVVRPPPPPVSGPDGAAAFLVAMMKTGYFLPLIKATEAVAGAALLSNRLVPLALTVLAPIVVNIVAFHVFLSPSGLGFAAVLVILEVYLAWTFRDAYRPLLALRSPAASPRAAR